MTLLLILWAVIGAVSFLCAVGITDNRTESIWKQWLVIFLGGPLVWLFGLMGALLQAEKKEEKNED